MVSRVATQLIDPETVANVTIDAVALTVDKTNDVLIFTNKNDKTLWMYDL
jgi:pyruvate/2-oxoglutarate/acetoin dehydrogenase E1 component